MFKFYKNGKEITPPKRIKWYFAEKPDAIFESAPDKLEINQNFWRKKLEMPTAQPVYVDSPDWQMVSEKITPIQEDDCTTTTATTLAPESDHSDGNDSTDTEFSVSESPEATVYTAKRKSGKKTPKLRDVSTDLSDDDSAAAE